MRAVEVRSAEDDLLHMADVGGAETAATRHPADAELVEVERAGEQRCALGWTGGVGPAGA